MGSNVIFDKLKSFLFLPKEEKEIVALDLGSGYVKGIYLVGNQVRKFFIDKNKGSGVKAVINWIKKEGLISKPTVLGIKGQDTLIRYIPFPKVDKKNLKNTFSYEIGKFIPFNKEEVYFDVFMVDENYSSGECLILLAVAKKEPLEYIIKQFTEEKISLAKIIPNNIGLVNLFINSQVALAPLASPGIASKPSIVKNGDTKPTSAKEASITPNLIENVAIIDIGYGSTLINLIKQNIPCLSREIKISASDFLDRLAKLKNISKDDAEKYFNQPIASGAISPAQEVIAVTEELASELCDEVKNSLDYFEVNWGKRVQAIYLTGGLSKLKGISKIMESSLGAEIKLWDPLSEAKLSFDQNIVSSKEMFACAVGLAL